MSQTCEGRASEASLFEREARVGGDEMAFFWPLWARFYRIGSILGQFGRLLGDFRRVLAILDVFCPFWAPFGPF